MKVTICTPTYNRQHTLKRLYDSLIAQTNTNFVWLIIDDGSSDNTESLVAEFIQENKINIQYHRQFNGGKHRAVNTGIDLVDSDYFAIVDSDDYLVPEAIEKIEAAFDTIAKNKHFAGIAFNKGYNRKEIIGKTFNDKYIDATSIDRKIYNILGDKFECFYTSILKENKFPTIEGEKFMSEIVLWTRIAAQGLKIRWFNDITYICEYLEGGLTHSNDRLIADNYQGYALRIKEQVTLAHISLKDKLGYYSVYYRIRKGNAGIFQIAKEIETSIFMVALAVFVRKILRK